jgi:membrane-associated protein
VLEIFLHLDAHLNEWITTLGPWVYVLLFVVVFCETGLVVMPFLPGDSLLFALGAVAAVEGSPLKLSMLLGILTAAAILGDAVNSITITSFRRRIFTSATEARPSFSRASSPSSGPSLRSSRASEK